MEFEFEGRTEKEAIDKAAEELGLEKDDFDVEILETQKQSLFKKGYVRIRVHTWNTTAERAPKSGATGSIASGSGSRTGSPRSDASRSDAPKSGSRSGSPRNTHRSAPRSSLEESGRGNYTGAVIAELQPQGEFEENMISFTAGLIERMGYPGKVLILFREKSKLGLKIESEHSSILIGKKGKNLDALQLLLNIYAGRLGRDDVRVILDTENYRLRREESLVRLAYNVAEKVRESRESILLEPMNPFDRWLIHTTLNDINDVETKSEGDGLYKQVRVLYRGFR
ncbi:MAG: protein jag [Treponema sp.]|jgi:spoIIIJ-associated protein|nr:protein jag [Treponema sp.]